MIRTKSRIIFFLLWVLISLIIFKQNGFAQEKPNILVLFVDDLGYHDLSYTGSDIYQTPAIDDLASEAVWFQQAYANYPRCVPSRYAIMTGSYPVKSTGVPDDGFKMKNVEKDKSFISKFNDLGYRTGYFGKWHLGDKKSSPESIGYDVSVAAGKAGSPISYFHPFNEPKGKNKNVKKAKIDMNFTRNLKEGDYLTDVMTDELIHFMDDSQQNGESFMAFMAFYGVHQPLEAKKEDVLRNKKEIDSYDFGEQPEFVPEGTGRTKMRQNHPVYAGMVENLDMNVGKVLSFLEEKGLDKNTIVVFSSDHGGLSNDGTKQRDLATSNFPLRAGKGWMYEGGIKVPLFIRYPGQIKARTEKRSIVMLMDLMPTLLDLAGGERIEGIPAKSMRPVLETKEVWDDRTVFWYASSARPVNTGESKSIVVRSGKWKLLHFYEEDRVELYNIAKDPYEQNDLSGKKKCKTKKLMKKIESWKESW